MKESIYRMGREKEVNMMLEYGTSKEETEEKKRASLDQNSGKARREVQCANRLGIRDGTFMMRKWYALALHQHEK